MSSASPVDRLDPPRPASHPSSPAPAVAGRRPLSAQRRVWQVLRYQFSERDLSDVVGFRAALLRHLRIFGATAHAVHSNDVQLRAAALTYNTLLSIVPLLAVVFSVFKAFGGLHKLEEPLRKMIVANLAAGSAEQVSRFLDQFVANVSAGAIAGLGVLVLFYSVVGMVVNAENSFNAIWGVRRGRPFLLRFAIYWALLTVAPAVVAFSISVTANLQQSPRVRELLGLMPEGLLPAGMRVGMQAASLLGVCFAFTLALVIIPHTRVRFRAAVAGGVVGGVIWHLSKMLYVYLSATAFRYSAIYGALGALPIFMIWIYVSWLIVLFAATYAYHVQQGIGVAPHARATLGSASQQYRERLSLNLCVALAAGLRSRQPLATARELAMGAGAPLSLVAELLHELALARLLIEVPARVGGGWTSHGDGRKSYTLAIDPHEATPAEVVALLREKLGASYPLATSDRQDQLEELLRRADQAAARILSEPRLATLAGSVQSQQR